MKPLISVIIPVYNAAQYVNRCLDSVINQTYRNIEIVLVDDGSKDESPQICDKYAQKDDRIKVIHKENGGLVSAWKAGVEASSGEYLTFIDSDDWVDVNMLEELAAHTTSGIKEIIASDYIIEREKDGALIPEYVYQSIAPGEYSLEKIQSEVIPNLLGHENRYITISRCMKLISSELINQNLKYADESIKMGEDMAIMLPAIIDCERLYIMDHKAYYHYLYVSESMVHKYDSGMKDSFEKLLQVISRVICEKEAEVLSDAVKAEKLFLLLLCVKNEARGNKKFYKENIKNLHDANRELLETTGVEIGSLSNKLLYRALRRPNAINLMILRLSMIIYYR